MSHSPTAQLGQGTGSGRRTMPTTRSPFFSAPLGPGSTTRPSDSWPRTRRVLPGGAVPYLPSTISTSVPHTPTATASTSTEPPRASGSGTSSSLAVPGLPGSTVMAFTWVTPRDELPTPDERQHHLQHDEQHDGDLQGLAPHGLRLGVEHGVGLPHDVQLPVDPPAPGRAAED